MVKLRDQTVNATGRILLSAIGLIASGVVGGGLVLNQVADDGTIKTTKTVAQDFVIAAITETGSTNAATRYDAVCIKNPLSDLGLGSGVIVRASVSNSANPAEVSGDLGFVKSCNDQSASGASIIDNTCTGTGCLSQYTTGTATWNGADYIKLTFGDPPTSSYSGRVRIQYEDYYGE